MGADMDYELLGWGIIFTALSLVWLDQKISDRPRLGPEWDFLQGWRTKDK